MTKLTLAALALLACAAIPAQAQQQYKPLGNAKVTIYCKTTTDGDTACPSSPITTTAPEVVTPTDKGGTITLGGTSQTAIAANASRKGCWIQNPVNATEDIYISSSAAAVTTAGTPDDADLAPGGAWSCLQGGNIIQTAIRIIAVTTAHAFIAKETQ